MSKSKDEEYVESAEHDQDKEDLQHKLSVIACVLIDLSQLLLCSLNVVQCLFCIVVNSLH